MTTILESLFSFNKDLEVSMTPPNFQFEPSNLLIKLLTDTAILPKYQHETDSGMDLHYDGEGFFLEPNKVTLVSTGISIQLPPNTEAQIRPRSGLAAKHGITIVNSPGTIDEGYQGEIKVIMLNLGTDPVWINSNDRIAQMIIAPVVRPRVFRVDEFDVNTNRGENGFGSTGVTQNV